MKLKFLVFSLIPAAVLLGSIELGVRVWGLANPAIASIPLPEEYGGLLGPDPELFWSLRPNLDMDLEGARVRTNSLSLRSSEPGAKLQGELRILSLGESTTFGVAVDDEQTYSARLEHHLTQRVASVPNSVVTRVRVLNAGVPAWSSFQSLMYLKLRGLALRPDLVLFYHELNDFMPSSLRDSSNNEIGLSLSDRQLHSSRRARLDRSLLNLSALYRFLVLRRARARIDALQHTGAESPLVAIGLPGIGIPDRALDLRAEPIVPSSLDENALPLRVSATERIQNLEELVSLCAEHGIELVILHPSYRDSRRHACSLTRFCKAREVPFFEAFNPLHPRGRKRGALFLDPWHPTVEGHDVLARGLSRWLAKRGLPEPAL